MLHLGSPVPVRQPGPDGFVDFFMRPSPSGDSTGIGEGPVLLLAVMPGRMRADELAFEENLDRVSQKPDLDVFALIAVPHPIGGAREADIGWGRPCG